MRALPQGVQPVSDVPRRLLADAADGLQVVHAEELQPLAVPPAGLRVAAAHILPERAAALQPAAHHRRLHVELCRSPADGSGTDGYLQLPGGRVLHERCWQVSAAG